MKKAKTLEELKVVQMDNSHFVTEEKLYRFSTAGLPLILLPHGSLIYTGNIARKETSPGGFPHGIFAVWKGEEEIEETKLVCIKGK